MLPSLSPDHLEVKLRVDLLDRRVLPETLGLLTLCPQDPTEGIPVPGKIGVDVCLCLVLYSHSVLSQTVMTVSFPSVLHS